MKVSLEEDRFHRFRLIEWWDQSRLADAKILVAGAGAIGNEVLKNLALLGVGRVLVADLDSIETSNLSRSVLFREADVGRPKAEVAAARAKELYPPMLVRGVRADVVHDLGLGLFRWADVAIGALDNREARVAINRAALRVSRPWIDGGIERLSGIARVFRPGAACYECTMNETDWKILEQRRSCSLLGRQMLQQGHVPTTPTTASIIAAIQCQEALKLLHGKETLDGGFLFEGMLHTSCVVRYPRKEDCLGHDAYESVLETEWDSSVRLLDVLDRARRELGEKAVLEFPRELLSSFDCPKCGKSERIFKPLSALKEQDAMCACGEERSPRLFHSVLGREDFLDRTLAEIGVPKWDIVGARAGTRTIGYELSGDRGEVLGELSGD